MFGGNRRRKRKNEDDPENGNHSVPFVDANPELGEVPLDDIDTFVIPSRDEKGGQSNVQFSMPPYMYRQIQVIVASRRFPYLDVADFIRHAIYRHEMFCVSIRNSIPKHISPSLEAMMEVCRDTELRLRVAAAYEEIERQITSLLNRMEVNEAIRLMTILKNRIDEVAPSPRQKQVRAEILRKYGYVIDHHTGTVKKEDETGGKGDDAGGFQ